MRSLLVVLVLGGCAPSGGDPWSGQGDDPETVEPRYPFEPVGHWWMTEELLVLRNGEEQHRTFPFTEVEEEPLDGEDCVRTTVYTPEMRMSAERTGFLRFTSRLTEEGCDVGMSNEYGTFDFGWVFRQDVLVLEGVGITASCELDDEALYCVHSNGSERWYARDEG